MNNVLTAEEFLQKQYDTEVYGLLGSKVESSISDILHAKLFELSRRRAKYVLIKLEAEETGKVLASGKLAGFNVTIPHKQNILPFLDSVDESAKRCGSVNTVLCREGKLAGYNTDLFGIEQTFVRMGYDPAGKRALILGTGGAALTCAAFLAGKGCEVAACSREREKVAAFAEKAKACSGAEVAAVTYETLRDCYDLIVNCTPCGMYPAEDAQALDIRQFSPEAVFDLVYNPLRTRLLRNARMGVRTANGLYMLMMQAAAAQKIFFGAEFEKRDLDRLYTELEALLFFKRLRDKFDKKSLALCGFMGCGKSHVARLIGKFSGLPVYDLDKIIEETEGKSISQIFEEAGESGFRDIESAALRRLSGVEGIISLGGGSVLREENVREIRKNSYLAFLDVPLEVIKKRLSGDTTRPLLSGDPEKLANLYDFRKGIYKSVADATVFGTNASSLVRNLFENL